MLIVVVIVLIAVVLMVAAGRADRRKPGAPTAVAEVSGAGFVLADGEATTVSWGSIYEATLTTYRTIGLPGLGRRSLLRTGFGFELRSEERGLLVLDGRDGRGEAFLANAHLLPGFDHRAVQEALVARTARTVCFSR